MIILNISHNSGHPSVFLLLFIGSLWNYLIYLMLLVLLFMTKFSKVHWKFIIRWLIQYLIWVNVIDVHLKWSWHNIGVVVNGDVILGISFELNFITLGHDTTIFLVINHTLYFTCHLNILSPLLLIKPIIYLLFILNRLIATLN